MDREFYVKVEKKLFSALLYVNHFLKVQGLGLGAIQLPLNVVANSSCSANSADKANSVYLKANQEGGCSAPTTLLSISCTLVISCN